MTSFDRLLDPSPMSLETGWERDENGVLHIACRTDMRGCTGEMFTWWFGSRPGPREYSWWHPIDHRESRWEGGTAGSAVGSTHIVTELMTNLPEMPLSIQFHEPDRFFTPETYRSALEAGHVTTAIVGHIADGHAPRRHPDGSLIGGRLLHIGRDTPWGLALRSHFYPGLDLPEQGMTYDEVVTAVPDALGANLLQHAYDEFTFLSRILPGLYTAENRDTLEITRPW